ncbi:60S ribosomal protein L11 [Histomonas meleagridis]|nr:60S ribosomal protein L11 [Histomonas meleagridis]
MAQKQNKLNEIRVSKLCININPGSVGDQVTRIASHALSRQLTKQKALLARSHPYNSKSLVFVVMIRLLLMLSSSLWSGSTIVMLVSIRLWISALFLNALEPRVAKRKHCRSRIGPKQRVTKEEAKEWYIQKFQGTLLK